MRAKDIMTPDVITVDPEMDVKSIARILLNHRISTVLVVDERGSVLGVVSEADLTRRSRRDPEPVVSGRDAPALLNLVDESLDQIAVAVSAISAVGRNAD